MSDYVVLYGELGSRPAYFRSSSAAEAFVDELGAAGRDCDIWRVDEEGLTPLHIAALSAGTTAASSLAAAAKESREAADGLAGRAVCAQPDQNR